MNGCSARAGGRRSGGLRLGHPGRRVCGVGGVTRQVEAAVIGLVGLVHGPEHRVIDGAPESSGPGSSTGSFEGSVASGSRGRPSGLGRWTSVTTGSPWAGCPLGGMRGLPERGDLLATIAPRAGDGASQGCRSRVPPRGRIRDRSLPPTGRPVARARSPGFPLLATMLSALVDDLRATVDHGVDHPAGEHHQHTHAREDVDDRERLAQVRDGVEVAVAHRGERHDAEVQRVQQRPALEE